MPDTFRVQSKQEPVQLTEVVVPWEQLEVTLEALNLPKEAAVLVDDTHIPVSSSEGIALKKVARISYLCTQAEDVVYGMRLRPDIELIRVTTTDSDQITIYPGIIR